MTYNLKDFKNASHRRSFLEKDLKVDLKNISQFSFSEEEVLGKNIENLIGAVSIPLGIAGPLLIQSSKFKVQSYYVPLATTEGALVASVSRGCKAISESGGAKVEIENVGVTRGPVFKTKGISHSREVQKWIEKNFRELQDTTKKTSSHLELLTTDFALSGKNLFIRFSFDCTDAMGMNMATIATEQIVKLVEEKTQAKCISVAGNYDIDKKPAWLNFISGRGKKVWAEAIISKKVVQEVLKTTPEKIVDLVYRKILVGSAMSGSMGFNAHYANIIAAIFASCGQDLGQVVEGSLGITSAEITDEGDLYFSIYLPSLMVGTVGGGTNLPTQKESLNIIAAKDVLEFSEVIAAAVLAGELSLLASQAQGTLAKAHIKYGRKGKK